MDVKRNDVLAFHEAFLEKAAAEQGGDPHPAQPDRAAMLDAAARHFDMTSARAVMLYGSRADGRNEESSDVDLLVLLENGKENTLDEEQKNSLKSRGIAHIVFSDNGLRYSLAVLPYSFFFGGELTANVRYFLGMKPLYDPTGDGTVIAEKTRSFVHSCSENCPGFDETLQRQIFDMLKEGRGDDLSAAVMRNSLLTESLSCLAACNGYLYIGDKRTAEILLRDAPHLADLYAAALIPGAGYEACAAWIEAAFAAPVSVGWECLDFSTGQRSFEKTVQDSSGRVYTLKELLTRKKEAADYIRGLCRYLEAEWINMEALLSESKIKAPQIYEYLWSRIV